MKSRMARASLENAARPCRRSGPAPGDRSYRGHREHLDLGLAGVSDGRNQRNQMRPLRCPAVDTQLGWAGRWGETTMIHDPSGSYATCEPLMVTRS